MEFRPIETAPKDSTFIYLIGDSGYTTFPFRVKVGRWVEGYRDFWVDHAGDSFEDDGGPPLFWSPIPPAHLLAYNALVLELEEKEKKRKELCKDRPESQEGEEQDWYFTFLQHHPHGMGYCVFHGTFSSARRQMFARFGDKWGFQYASKEEAGVDKYGLYKVT